MTRRRAALAALLALLAAPAAPSHAALPRPAHQLVDPKGDARVNVGFADLVTGDFSTAGVGDERLLVATLTLAGPPRTDAGFTYQLGANVRGCGPVAFSYTPFSVSGQLVGPNQLYVGCGIEESPTSERNQTFTNDVSVTVHGRSITWTIPLAVLPKEIGSGAFYSQLVAVADVAEPAFGIPVGDIQDQSIDVGHGAVTWRVP